MIPTISQVCSLDSPFQDDIADYAAGQCRSIEVWLTKLEQYLEVHSTDAFLKLISQHDVSVPVASFQGGLLASHDEKREPAWALFERRLELCRTLGISTLVVAADIAGPISQQALEQIRELMQQVAESAQRYEVKIAIEFQARAAFANNLQTAAALIEEIQGAWLGLCLDAFHFFIGPSKLHDLGLVTRENLFHVQFSDLAGVPREIATDSDRILPGDGDFLLEPIVQRLREIDYQGCVSLELMNPHIWQVPALQLGEIGTTALRTVLGQAEMQ